MKSTMLYGRVLIAMLAGLTLWVAYDLGYSDGRRAEQKCWYGYPDAQSALGMLEQGEMLAKRLPGSPPFRQRGSGGGGGALG